MNKTVSLHNYTPACWHTHSYLKTLVILKPTSEVRKIYLKKKTCQMLRLASFQ